MVAKLPHARIIYTSEDKIDELASGFLERQTINVNTLELRGSRTSLECNIISI